MLVGCIAGTGEAEIAWTNSNISSDVYDQIILSHIDPFIQSLSDSNERIFIQDNAPAHKSEQCLNTLYSRYINIIEHLPYSPDMNPIEMMF